MVLYQLARTQKKNRYPGLSVTNIRRHPDIVYTTSPLKFLSTSKFYYFIILALSLEDIPAPTAERS